MNTKLRFNPVILISLILFGFISGSCEKDEIKIKNSDLIVLFQYEYMNWAWGFSHAGWFIDNKGNVQKYVKPENWISDSSGYYDYAGLISNYNQTIALIGQVDLEELNEKSALIVGTLNGQLSEIECHGADMGSLNYYCYSWDPEKKKFKRQLLSSGGDCEQINTTPEAIELTEYLKGINHLF